MSRWRLETYDLSKKYRQQKTFDCGNEMINRYVQKNLKKRVKNHTIQAYVLSDKENNNDFIGFYTLESFTIAKDIFQIFTPPPATPPLIPVLKLGMLGIDKRYQGKGLGRKLLKNAVKKTAHVSMIAGCKGLYLLAEENAVSFYRRLGFLPLQDLKPTPMFLDIDLILDALLPQQTKDIINDLENAKENFETPISYDQFVKDLKG